MQSKRRAQYRFLARAHFWVLGLSLFGYLALAFMLGPGFLSFDVNQKIRALADELIVVTAVVLGPPATPVVTATPSCVGSAPRITLDWADDAATTSWDIDRDGSPLVTGLTSSSYVDTAVSGTTSYTYTVTAYGPMSPGIATSLGVSGTAIDCSTLLPPASLTLTRLGGKDITPPRSLPIKLDDSRPRLRGNTNVGNAIVDISLTRPTIYARVTANANGYFTWKPPRALHAGRHTLIVTVTDPNDSSRTASETLEFTTRESDEEEEKQDSANILDDTLTFDFTITLENPGATVEQGERLEFSLRPVKGLFPSETVFESSLVNERGETVYTAPEERVRPEGRPGLRWSLETPVYLPEGKYSLLVEALMGDVSMTRSASFALTAKPILQLGGRQVITYAEVASFIGWIFFGALLIFVTFFLFLLREYWLYLHSAHHVTERELRRLGMIPWRKEVGKS